ncbi:MAG: ThuA domain-containing protein [Chthoniobacteraceae bacterium]
MFTSRRSLVRSLALAAFGFLSLEAASFAAAKPKILFFSKSSAFEHSVISYKNGKPSLVEKALTALGEKNGWDFTFSKDGSLFSPEYLKQFAAVFFYTTGDLTTPGTDGQPPMSPAGKQALLDYVAAGGGFIGTHSAADTFHTANESKKGPDRYANHGKEADPYVLMLGGEFIKHDAQQSAKMRCADPHFPGMEKYADGFEMTEEWYSLKDFPDDMHVLLVQETGTMKGPDYQRPPYPATWARAHGKGRVFYTSMGHRDDVWSNPVFLDILTGGIRFALGEAKADITPNIRQVTPGAWKNPPFVEAKPAAAPKAK